jgi:hypothetical protein
LSILPARSLSLVFDRRGGAGRRVAHEEAGSLRAHAAIHATVETQLAEGLGCAVRAMERLVEQGLDRHEAVHAIGSVVAAQLYAALQHRAFDSAEYEARLDALTADSWRKSADET